MLTHFSNTLSAETFDAVKLFARLQYTGHLEQVTEPDSLQYPPRIILASQMQTYDATASADSHRINADCNNFGSIGFVR